MPQTTTSHVTFEPPYLVYWHLIGRVEEKHVVDIFAKQLDFARKHPQFFVFTNVSRLESVTPGARRAMADGSYADIFVPAIRGSAVIGASFHFQVLGSLVYRASKMIHKQLDIDVQFFATEVQARAWLEKRCRDLESKSVK
ncbi:MAG TPA: hypothetical protein PKA58_09290 [Polyangium sp.]|jgi:hypothetical protein|nr:hypothetical protein [Polyangium sp.]